MDKDCNLVRKIQHEAPNRLILRTERGEAIDYLGGGIVVELGWLHGDGFRDEAARRNSDEL
nr:hypothetical protein [uncultured Azospirillum sp.]